MRAHRAGDAGSSGVSRARVARWLSSSSWHTKQSARWASTPARSSGSRPSSAYTAISSNGCCCSMLLTAAPPRRRGPGGDSPGRSGCGSSRSLRAGPTSGPCPGRSDHRSTRAGSAPVRGRAGDAPPVRTSSASAAVCTTDSTSSTAMGDSAASCSCRRRRAVSERTRSTPRRWVCDSNHGRRPPRSGSYRSGVRHRSVNTVWQISSARWGSRVTRRASASHGAAVPPEQLLQRRHAVAPDGDDEARVARLGDALVHASPPRRRNRTRHATVRAPSTRSANVPGPVAWTVGGPAPGRGERNIGGHWWVLPRHVIPHISARQHPVCVIRSRGCARMSVRRKKDDPAAGGVVGSAGWPGIAQAWVMNASSESRATSSCT